MCRIQHRSKALAGTRGCWRQHVLAAEFLFAPAPEDFPGGDQFLHDARRGEIEEAATVGELAIFLLDSVGAEETQVALELQELLASHGVAGERVGTLSHEGWSLSDSL